MLIQDDNANEILKDLMDFEKNDSRKIDFVKIRDVKTPSRANQNDAGIDFYVPNYNEKFLEDLIKKNPNRRLKYEIKESEEGKLLLITIEPHERILIPSGIKVNIHNKMTYLRFDNKSGIADKFGLTVGSDIVDADYRGEMHISLINTGDSPAVIMTGMKVIQAIHSLKYNTNLHEISEEEFDNLPSTDRGTGGFGSSTLK